MIRHHGVVRRAAVSAAALVLLLAAGCDTAKVMAPPPPLEAASASDFAVDLQFASPLDRASAEDPSRYAVYPLGTPGAAVAVFRATLVDTLYGRVVQLLLSGGPLADSVVYSVEARGVDDYGGRSLGKLSAEFRAGLSYREQLSGLLAAHCNSCHGEARADGMYRTDSYSALFGSGTHSSPDLVPSDPGCLLVVKTKPRNSMFRDGGLTFLDAEILRNWVVSYGARP